MVSLEQLVCWGCTTPIPGSLQPLEGSSFAGVLPFLPLPLQPLEGNQSLAYFPFVPYDAVLTTGSAVVGFDFGFPTVRRFVPLPFALLFLPVRASLRP